MKRTVLAATALAVLTLLTLTETSQAQRFGFRAGYGNPYYSGYYPGYWGGNYWTGNYGTWTYPAYSWSYPYRGYYYPSYSEWYSYPTTSTYYSAQAPMTNSTTSQSFYQNPEEMKTPAQVRILVPADSQISFDGQATSQRGMDRLFVSPPLTPGRDFVYEIKAQWTENGREMSKTKSVQVHAGDFVNVNFVNAGERAANQAEGTQQPPTQNQPPTSDQNRPSNADQNAPAKPNQPQRPITPNP
jgi:uncharacterized protein (TIGR03000 family)